MATNARGVWLAMRHEIPATLASGGGAVGDRNDALLDEHPMGRMASEEELASAVLWLCSAGAGFVTRVARSLVWGGRT